MFGYATVHLKDLCNIKGRIGFRGYTSHDMVDAHKGAISMSPGNIENNHISYSSKCTYISWEKYYESPEIILKENDIILCKTGSTLGKVAKVTELLEPSTINPQLVVLKDIACNVDFLFYVLSSNSIQKQIQSKKGLGSVPNISQKDLGEIVINLPGLSKQSKLVSILNKFNKLCNDISEGLPAEIEARQKQYEYYRDKLLTFKPLKEN